MALPNFEVPPMECPAVLLPTPANLTNMFGTLATIPDRVIAMAKTTAQDEAQQYIDMAEDLKSMVEDIRKFFSAYDPKNKKAIFPEKEWEVMITRLLEEYPMYIQTEILSLVHTLFPVIIPLPLLGMQIDLIKLVTDRAYLTELMAEVQGFGADVQAQIDALSSDLSPEELKAEIDKLRGDKLDAIYAMLPDEYKLFNGDYGLETAEWKGKQIVDYIKNEATKFMNNLMFAGFTGLIGIFTIIWSALGLPAIPGKEAMNAGELIKGIVTAEKAKMAAQLEALGDNPAQAAKDELKNQMDLGIVEGLKGIKVFGFDVMSLLGGEFTDGTFSIEFQVARINQKLKEFEANWQLFLLKTWLQKITAFLNAIGLGALTQFITLDFCTFMGLMGIPTTINLSSFGNISTVASALNPDLKILDTLSAADNAADTFTSEIMSAGQDIIEGSFTAGVTVVNKSNLLVAFTEYTVESGNIVLDAAAAAGDEYLVIPDPDA